MNSHDLHESLQPLSSPCLNVPLAPKYHTCACNPLSQWSLIDFCSFVWCIDESETPLTCSQKWKVLAWYAWEKTETQKESLPHMCYWGPSWLQRDAWSSLKDLHPSSRIQHRPVFLGKESPQMMERAIPIASQRKWLHHHDNQPNPALSPKWEKQLGGVKQPCGSCHGS